MLVPEVAGGAAGDLADLRAACDCVVETLVAAHPERIVVLGPGKPDPLDRDATAGGTLAPFGVDLAAGGPDRVLPLAHTIGAWLLDRAGWTGERRYTTGPPAGTEEPEAWLVMADGSAKRSDTAPGYLDARAEGFDARIAAALADGDPEALAGLDLTLADDLWCTGAAPLAELGRTLRGARVARARVHYDGAPRGVGYWAADWQL